MQASKTPLDMWVGLAGKIGNNRRAAVICMSDKMHQLGEFRPIS